MKRLVLGLVACGALLTARAETMQWLTDVPKAQAQAKEENKLVLLDFTGSDWCQWCKRLKAEVFSTPEFADYAKKNLVPVEVDFPIKTPISDKQKATNDKLKKQFNVDGYPTVIILKPDGQKLGTLGYQPGGPKAFIASLEKLRGK